MAGLRSAVASHTIDCSAALEISMFGRSNYVHFRQSLLMIEKIYLHFPGSTLTGAVTLYEPNVPPQILKKLRAICLAIPRVTEERAWVGVRWCINSKNFAHVLMINNGHPPAYAKIARSSGPICVLTFRSSLAEFDPAIFRMEPYFKPEWFSNIAGMKLDEKTDWQAVKDHILASCQLLGKKP
jgi:hypothetical protein